MTGTSVKCCRATEEAGLTDQTPHIHVGVRQLNGNPRTHRGKINAFLLSFFLSSFQEKRTGSIHPSAARSTEGNACCASACAGLQSQQLELLQCHTSSAEGVHSGLFVQLLGGGSLPARTPLCRIAPLILDGEICLRTDSHQDLGPHT